MSILSFLIELGVFLCLAAFIAVCVREIKRLKKQLELAQFNVDPSTIDQVARIVKKHAVIRPNSAIFIEYNHGKFNVFSTEIKRAHSEGATLGIALTQLEVKVDHEFDRLKKAVHSI